MFCDICSGDIPFPAMAMRYRPAQIATLADALDREPGVAVSALQVQVERGPLRSQGGPAFANFLIGVRHHMTMEWHVCPQCALAIDRVLQADPSLAVMVGAGRSGM